MQSQLPWDHKYGQGDLDIVFDNVRQMGHSDQIVTKRLLKVIYGTKIMVSEMVSCLDRTLMLNRRRL